MFPDISSSLVHDRLMKDLSQLSNDRTSAVKNEYFVVHFSG